MIYGIKHTCEKVRLLVFVIDILGATNVKMDSSWQIIYSVFTSLMSWHPFIDPSDTLVSVIDLLYSAQIANVELDSGPQIKMDGPEH